MDSCKIICKHSSNSKIPLFCSIIIYILHIIKKLKSQKNNHHKRINKISNLEALLLIRILCRKKLFIYWCILSVFKKFDRWSNKLRAKCTRQKLGLEEQKPGATNLDGLMANRESNKRDQSAHSSSKLMRNWNSCYCNWLYCCSSNKLIENWGRCYCNWLYFGTNFYIPLWLYF